MSYVRVRSIVLEMSPEMFAWDHHIRTGTRSCLLTPCFSPTSTQKSDVSSLLKRLEKTLLTLCAVVQTALAGPRGAQRTSPPESPASREEPHSCSLHPGLWNLRLRLVLSSCMRRAFGSEPSPHNHIRHVVLLLHTRFIGYERPF